MVSKIKIEDWTVFFQNHRLYGDALLEIFPYKANFNEMVELLEYFKNDKVFNNEFDEVLWRFPNNLNKGEMTTLLQTFLLKNYHHSHEGIISELQSIYNTETKTIKFLLMRLESLPAYYSKDEDLKYPFIRKLIYAIGAQLYILIRKSPKFQSKSIPLINLDGFNPFITDDKYVYKTGNYNQQPS